jgi:hypothetical protein
VLVGGILQTGWRISSLVLSPWRSKPSILWTLCVCVCAPLPKLHTGMLFTAQTLTLRAMYGWQA